MGLTQGEFPPVDPATFPELPYRERIKILSRHWAEYGFGAPKITAVIYVVKLLVFFCIGGILLSTLTSGEDPLSVKDWWDQPIIWQKIVAWVFLLEGLGLAGSWGPLAGHFKPMTGGVLYYGRTGTLRNPPWPTKIPGTAGASRTIADVALYAGWAISLALIIVLPGVDDSDTTAAIGPNEGLVSAIPCITALVCLGLLGLRDKIAFLQARAEQYGPALFFFAFFPFVDMIVAAKLLIVIVWCGGGGSQLGRP